MLINQSLHHFDAGNSAGCAKWKIAAAKKGSFYREMSKHVMLGHIETHVLNIYKGGLGSASSNWAGLHSKKKISL